MILTSCSLINFALAEDNICYILLIDLFSPFSSNLDGNKSKSLYIKSIVITIAKLVQISLFSLMVAF